MKVKEVVEICQGTLLTPDVDLDVDIKGGFLGT